MFSSDACSTSITPALPRTQKRDWLPMGMRGSCRKSNVSFMMRCDPRVSSSVTITFQSAGGCERACMPRLVSLPPDPGADSP